LKHGDLLGFAHRGRLSLIQSMKSTNADYLYSMPQFLGSRNDASVRVFGLAREEVSFDRREVGTSFGLRRRLESIGTDAGLRYQYESVRAENFTGDPSEAPTDSRVGTFILDLTRDRLDNPITPKRGYLLSGSFETAAQAFGGDVNYERMDFGIGWHEQLASQSFVHVGLRQGLVWAFGEAVTEIPLGRRFFPGGEDTIRGYGQGKASPRNANGDYIGAETATILNLEFEQALTENFSGVVFVDAGLMGAELSRFPGDERRVSVGLGVRYNTVIGPLRLEYGHNIVREPGDQKGHVHFALGFPF
jgi:outer membrane translocation and assembly module TamA